MPTRATLSPYAGPMPRPVVPILRLPRNRSVTLSRARWCGMIRCASEEMTSREVSTPALLQAGELADQHLGVDDHAVADDRRAARRQDARRDQVQRVPLAVRRDHRVAGVVAALVADDVGDAATEQVGGLALALVAPLGTDQHDSRHRVLVLLVVGRIGRQPGGSRLGQMAGYRHGLRRVWTSAAWSRARPPDRRTSPRPRDAESVAVRGPGPGARRRPHPAAEGGPHRAGAGRLGAGRRQGLPRRWPATSASAPASSGSSCLVRDDHGGVLLHHGRIEAAGDGRAVLSRRLGLQAHHDDIKVADGEITRIDVRPDWQAVDTIGVTVMTQPLRPTRHTSGRALQMASDPARIVRDGVAVPAAGHPLDLVRRRPGALAAAALTAPAATRRPACCRQAGSWTLDAPRPPRRPRCRRPVPRPGSGCPRARR